MINTWTWCVWLLAGLVSLSSTRNPAYLLIIFLVTTWVHTALDHHNSAPQSLFSPLPFSGFVTLTASVFNALTAHFGDTVLLTIPGQIPLVSGPVTVEALVYGALNGLVLSGLFVLFTVFNRALPARALIRLIPRAFSSLAVVISIAVTFIPATRRQFERIREAQAVRGHRSHSLRDALPLFMPLLVGGLERAFQLAEAMSARGFSGQGETAARDLRNRLALLAGLLLVLAGWLLKLTGCSPLLTWSLIATGGLWIVTVLSLISSRSKHTTYRTERWSVQDGIVLLGAALVLGVFLAPSIFPGRYLQNYHPYPQATLPPFNPWVGCAILGLLPPAFLVDSQRT